MPTHRHPGRLILSNVKNAIRVRDESSAAMAGLLVRLRMSEDDLVRAHDAHCQFIRNGISFHAAHTMKERQMGIDYLENLEGYQSTV